MAKYDVKFSCGHTERKELFGAEKERQSKIAYWERNGICSECYKKAQEQEAAKFSQENALPTLEGSEKQIAWAEKIRAEKLAGLKERAEKSLKLLDELENVSADKVAQSIAAIGEEKHNETIAKLKDGANKHISAYEKAKAETSAKWWIENR